jgi:hypothetical protein
MSDGNKEQLTFFLELDLVKASPAGLQISNMFFCQSLTAPGG